MTSRNGRHKHLPMTAKGMVGRSLTLSRHCESGRAGEDQQVVLRGGSQDHRENRRLKINEGGSEGGSEVVLMLVSDQNHQAWPVQGGRWF